MHFDDGFGLADRPAPFLHVVVVLQRVRLVLQVGEEDDVRAGRVPAAARSKAASHARSLSRSASGSLMRWRDAESAGR